MMPPNANPFTSDSHGNSESIADLSTPDIYRDPDSIADPSTPDSHGNSGSNTNLSTLGVYGDSDSDSSSDTDDGTDPFPEEQGAASHSLDGSSSSYYTDRPSFIAPSGNAMSTQSGYQRAQQLQVSHSHGAGTVSKKPCVGQCIKDSIYVQSNHRDLSANQAPSRKCEGCEAKEEGGKLFLEASSKKMQLRKLEREIKKYEGHISDLEAQKKEQIDATGSTNLQEAIDAAVFGYEFKAEIAKLLRRKIQEGMKEAGKSYSTQYTSFLKSFKP
ncbi:hypothetical protein BASA83_005932 [Batrachochytrium salamandrivorans]|nr:hypothetical protein BASA83_005932 [Batrachochytrium salamandrivorans]